MVNRNAVWHSLDEFAISNNHNSKKIRFEKGLSYNEKIKRASVKTYRTPQFSIIAIVSSNGVCSSLTFVKGPAKSIVLYSKIVKFFNFRLKLRVENNLEVNRNFVEMMTQDSCSQHLHPSYKF